MKSVRLLSLCAVLGLPANASADLAPPGLRQTDSKAEAAAAAAKIATCSPSYEERPGPRGTLITHRTVEYDVIAGEVAVTPPEARAPLRAWVDRIYRAVRPCLPPAAALRPPERLPVKLHIFLSSGRVVSAVALSNDRRVDTKCTEGILIKQEAPPPKVAVAQLSVDVTLAPFCVLSHEVEGADGFPEPLRMGYGRGSNRHLMPPASAAPR